MSLRLTKIKKPSATRYKLQVLCGLFLLGLHTHAWALVSDHNEPYQISADQATYDRKHHTTTYFGHVHVTQGSSELEGDTVVVYQNANNFILHIVSWGKLAHYSTLPEPGKDRMHARADSIDYNPSKKMVWLSGHGQVIEGEELFSGPRIWYDMTHGLVRTDPNRPDHNPLMTASGEQGSAIKNTEEPQRTVIILPGNSHASIPTPNASSAAPLPGTQAPAVVPHAATAT